MRVLSIANFKGGCAKTSTAVSLGACLAELGKKVLLVDLDAQMSATQWLGLQMDSKALFEVFSGDSLLEAAVITTTCKNLYMVPGSRWLLGLDKALAGEIGAELILQRKIEELPEKWDFIILDCPPSTGITSLSALCASDYLLIPLEPTSLNTGGLVHMLQTVKQVQERLNSKLQIAGILPCRVDKRTRLAKEIIEGLRKRFGDLICKVSIRESIKMKECSSFGRPITLFAPKEKVTDDYRKLSKEIIKRMESNDKIKNRV